MEVVFSYPPVLPIRAIDSADLQDGQIFLYPPVLRICAIDSADLQDRRIFFNLPVLPYNGLRNLDNKTGKNKIHG